MISLITKQSPTFFLTSLGAMTAILLLVFKDAILGFVGSIQIASNDMVRIGDWVSMEKYGADGDVLEINLTTVKVQNWDRTITTIPTYAFVSDSFKNWRGMSDSGGRRIKRSVNIQIDTIKFASPDLINRLFKVKMLGDFIQQREEEIKKYNQENNLDESQINARRQTNIGLFRRYLDYYLKNHEQVHQGMTIMVRQLQPTEKGLPLEVYCFTNTVAWLEYESIASDIFDHIFSVVTMFDLAIHEQPTNDALKGLVKELKK
jgi:miniconductance mechanosensitive channel